MVEYFPMWQVAFLGCSLIYALSLSYCSYDNDGTSKDEIKERFSQTMEFVENYLRDVVCQSFPFADKEKNKLTFEVSLAHSHSHVTVMLSNVVFMVKSAAKLFFFSCLGGKSGQELNLFWLLQLQRSAEANQDPAGYSGLCPCEHHFPFQQAEQRR